MSASVVLFEDPDDLDHLLALLNDGRGGRCFEEELRRDFEEAPRDQVAVEFGSVEIQQPALEGLGDTGGGFQLTADATLAAVGGATISAPISYAYQFVRVDRALVDVWVVTIAVECDGPTADRAALLEVLVDAVSD